MSDQSSNLATKSFEREFVTTPSPVRLATNSVVAPREAEIVAEEEYREADAGDGTRVEDQQVHGVKLFLTIISCLFCLFLSALDSTIVSTILSDVGNKFHAFEKIGWMTSGFFLPMAALTPSYGKVSIAFGRKNVLLVGVFVFEAGSLVAALAQNMDMLIGGRVIQGIGGGAIMSMVSVILTEAVHVSKRSLVFSLLGVTFALASILGPFIGGALSTHVTWRWCFYINLPIGGFAAVMLFFSFNPPRPHGNLRLKLSKIDYVGTFLISSGLVLFLLALTWGGAQFSWKSSAVISCFVLSFVVMCVFTVWNFWFSKNPIILKPVITNFKAMAAILSCTFSYGYFLCALTYLAVYFQVIFNYSAWKSGVLMLPFFIAVTVTSVFSGVLIKVTRYIKPVLLASMILGPIGNGLFLLLEVHTPVGKRIGLLIIAGVSVGMLFQSTMLSAQLEAPRDMEGAVIMITVFLTFCRTMGAAISVAVGQVIYQTLGPQNIRNMINKLPKDSDSYKELTRQPIEALIAAPELIQKLDSKTKDMVLGELLKALHAIFYFCLAMSFCALISSLFTTNKRVPEEVKKTDDVKEKEDKDDSIREKENGQATEV